MRTLTDEDLDMLRTELDAEPEAPDEDDTTEWPTAHEADAAWLDGYYTARDGKQVIPPTHPALVDLYLDGFQAGLREQARQTPKAEALAQPEEWEPEPGSPFLTFRQWEVIALCGAAFGSANVKQSAAAIHVPITAERIRSWPLFHDIVSAGAQLTDTVFEPGCWIDLNHPELGA